MTTAAKPLPAHGTQYRYKGATNGSWPGCRCNICTRAHSRACTLRAVARLSGKQLLYPAEQLVAHIATLNASGMTNAAIARRANVSASTISYLINGKTQSCLRDKALRILGVRPGDFDDRAERPAIGSSRRVQALYALGHSPAAIAAESGLNESTISHLVHERSTIIAGPHAAAIDTAYRALQHSTGTSRKARCIARLSYWKTPDFWEDWGRIDDPTFDPLVAERSLNRNELAEVRRAEIEHLASYGHDAEQIKARLEESGDEISVSHIQAVMREYRTGVKKPRGKQPATAAATAA